MNIEVLKINVFTKEDYANMKYLFKLQDENPDLVVINSYIRENRDHLFPDIDYHVYIEETFSNDLKKKSEQYKKIYYDWADDLYEYNEVCGKENRCTEIIKIIKLDDV